MKKHFGRIIKADTLINIFLILATVIIGVYFLSENLIDYVTISQNVSEFRIVLQAFSVVSILILATWLSVNLEGVFLKKMAQNVVLLWYVPSRYFYDSSLSIVIGRKFYTVALNLMTILSFVYFYRLGRKKMILGYLVVFIGFTFPYAIGHAATTRFKLDFEYLQYVLVAAYLYSIVIQRYKKTSLN